MQEHTVSQDALQTPHARLERAGKEVITASLGIPVTREDIRSTMGPFKYFPEAQTVYPESVTTAIGDLYAEYNEAFKPMVEANQEWDTDYQYCKDENGNPVNYFVQVDMQALPPSFLEEAQTMDPTTVKDKLRGDIFEIENSLAMYQLLERIFGTEDDTSVFDARFRASLDSLRQKFGKPIALLAVTDQKHQAMRETEFGKVDGEELTDGEVAALSGFDAFFGPEEFKKHVEENGGDSAYLLYARTSDPVAKLKKPSAEVDNPLLADDDMRRVIKANALTMNVDNPAWEPGDPRRINDTKGYMEPMGMAKSVGALEELYSDSFAKFLDGQALDPSIMTDAGFFSDDFASYLEARGVDPVAIQTGEVRLRFKPEQGTYGCYGHESGLVTNRKDRGRVKKQLRDRGRYVVQPEMAPESVHNQDDGRSYDVIHRNFFAYVDGQPTFLGGFASHMPNDTVEAAKGRNHGSAHTVWSEVVG